MLRRARVDKRKGDDSVAWARSVQPRVAHDTVAVATQSAQGRCRGKQDPRNSPGPEGTTCHAAREVVPSGPEEIGRRDLPQQRSCDHEAVVITRALSSRGLSVRAKEPGIHGVTPWIPDLLAAAHSPG